MEPRTSRSTPPGTPPAAAGPAPAAFTLARAAELVRGPLDAILPTLSAALALLVAHTVAAELSGQCAHSPFKVHLVHGDTGPAPHVTVADLQALEPRVTPGRPWHGTAVLGGEERAVLAIASEAAPMAGRPPLLVLVLASPAARRHRRTRRPPSSCGTWRPDTGPASPPRPYRAPSPSPGPPPPSGPG